MFCLDNLLAFEKILKNIKIDSSASLVNSPLIYVEMENYFLYDESKVIYPKVPAIGGARFLFALKLLEAINNRYMPIFNKEKQLLYSEEEFLEFRKKMGGIREYGADNLEISDNLRFEGVEEYLSLIDNNIFQVTKKRQLVIAEVMRILGCLGLKTTIGNNSNGDIELVETGSTMRGTNLPIASNSNWDFDYTVRIDPDKVWIVKSALEFGFTAQQHITRTSNYKVRLQGVKIPGLTSLIDLDFSLTPQKEHYLATEDVIKEQLENIKEQDEEKYRLVLANIMYAKAFFKKVGVYKPSRGILDGDRQLGGIGGIGIENWILQNGGSFIEAAKEFLKHAEGKSFLEFEKEYAIMDFGKNHVEVSKGNFPHDNFIMKNMREKGYNLMKPALKQFLETIEIEKKKLENQNNNCKRA